MGDPKEALERDLEQTKSDLPGVEGQDIDQDVDDTVKQAVGKDDDDNDGDGDGDGEGEGDGDGDGLGGGVVVCGAGQFTSASKLPSIPF
jgi:hypothetical protein